MGTQICIGDRLAALRGYKNWTQADLAAKLSVSDKAVSKWEKNGGAPSLEFIPALAKLFDVTTDYLLMGTNPPSWIPEKTAPDWKPMNAVLTLKAVDITGEVLGRFGLFKIVQSYENTTAEAVEVFYTFPISKSAAVYDFTAKIGDKTIKGVVKEKGEAKRDYQKALVAGDSAYLLENAEGNIFKITVGKIAPKEKVEIALSYIDVLEILQNTVELRIPTVVAPRYNSKITAAQTYQGDAGYRANITIQIDKALKLADVLSPSHSIKVADRTVTTLDAALDKDYILNIKMRDEALSSGYSFRAPDGETYALLQFMPELPEPKFHTPKAYVFVADCSGSMDGIKIEKTRAALKKCLGQIKTGDTFTLMRFGSRYSAMTAGLLDATPDNLNAGAAYIDRLDADDGGTVIGAPLLHALSAYGDGVTVILVTDGQIGGEQTLISEVRGVIGQSRLFIFGIDSAVNDDGLTRLAQAGHGKAEFIVPDERLDDKIVRQFARINGAGCATVRLDVGVNAVKDVLKSGGALFNHEYWWSFVKLKAVKGGFGLCCTVNGKEYRTELPLAQIRQTQLAVDKQYALQKVRQIEAYIARNRYGNDDGSTESYEKQIVEIAVRYHVATKYTSFLAVNERDGKIFDVPAQEQIALDLPSGWNRTSDEFYTIDYCYCPAKPAYAPRFSLSPMPAPLQGSAPVQTSALPTPAYEPALGRGITENSVVTVRFTGNGREKTVVIRAAGYTGPAIASAEAISIDSPFAQALLGKKEGADFFYTSELGIVYTGTIEKVIAAPETTQNDGARPQKG